MLSDYPTDIYYEYKVDYCDYSELYEDEDDYVDNTDNNTFSHICQFDIKIIGNLIISHRPRAPPNKAL